MLQEKYGKGIKRRTSYDEIEQIDASAVVSANQRLYVNREDGFIGLNWRQHEFVTECTILDSVLAIMKDGSLKVSKVGDKVFMGREIIHIAIWPKDGDTNFYTMVYQDGETGKAFAKKFQIGGLSRDKLYPLVKIRELARRLPGHQRQGEGHAEDDPRLARRPQRRPRPRTRFRPDPGAREHPHRQGPHGHQVAGEGSAGQD